MKNLTPQDAKTMEMAEANLRAIKELEEAPEFAAFMGRFRRRADELANQVLHEDMTPEAREAARQYRLGILEVLAAPATDRAANERILAEYARR